jgi:hypothetical protein
MDAEVRADARDAADIENLDRLFAVVRLTHAQVCRIPAPTHPERRWDVRDLLDALSGAMTDIAAERDRIRNSAVCLEDV